MVLAALYVWCQLNRDVVVQFWFGLQFKAVYLPWVLAAFNFVLAGEYVPIDTDNKNDVLLHTYLCYCTIIACICRFMAEFLGIVAGHLYYFLKFTYPQDHGGPRLLETPEFLCAATPHSGLGCCLQVLSNEFIQMYSFFFVQCQMVRSTGARRLLWLRRATCAAACCRRGRASTQRERCWPPLGTWKSARRSLKN